VHKEIGAATQDAEWWRQAVVYQIYPRSFADVDGDGIGDLKGIASRIDYIKSLSVDAVWLNPFYPSALADGGYDVSDYQDVDPRLGTLEDFDVLVADLHAAGIKILVDIVPNHSSNEHAWFQEALAAPEGSPARDRYIFRNGRGQTGELPPNDWPSHFGPRAWSRTTNADGTPGQWYLHLFAPEQPDFNWDNPDVHEYFIETLRFWADRGVDGFRVDVAHGLKKDLSEPFRPVTSIGVIADLPEDGSHPLFDRDDVHEVYRSWRKVFNEYEPPLIAVAEAGAPARRRAQYASPDGLGQAFNFDLTESYWDAESFRTIIDRNLAIARASGSSSTWTLSNHDTVRHLSRYALPQGTDLNAWLLSDGASPVADLERGLRRARAAVMLMLALPGSTYLYQGEELGLPEVPDLPREALQDPMWFRDRGARKGRDGCRVPLPWTASGAAYGFSSGSPHLPMPEWFADLAVDRQSRDHDTTLELYRTALRLRRELQSTEALTWHDGPAGTVWFSRENGWTSFTNFGEEPVPAPEGVHMLTSNGRRGHEVPGETTLWLLR
jgi:alpha-glucosidase